MKFKPSTDMQLQWMEHRHHCVLKWHESYAFMRYKSPVSHYTTCVIVNIGHYALPMHYWFGQSNCNRCLLQCVACEYCLTGFTCYDGSAHFSARMYILWYFIHAILRVITTVVMILVCSPICMLMLFSSFVVPQYLVCSSIEKTGNYTILCTSYIIAFYTILCVFWVLPPTQWPWSLNEFITTCSQLLYV